MQSCPCHICRGSFPDGLCREKRWAPRSIAGDAVLCAVTLTHVLHFATGVAVFSVDLSDTPEAFSCRCWAQVMLFSYLHVTCQQLVEMCWSPEQQDLPWAFFLNWSWSFAGFGAFWFSFPSCLPPFLVCDRVSSHEGCPLAWGRAIRTGNLGEKRTWLSVLWGSLKQTQGVWLSLRAPLWCLKTSLLSRGALPSIRCSDQFSQGLCLHCVCARCGCESCQASSRACAHCIAFPCLFLQKPSAGLTTLTILQHGNTFTPSAPATISTSSSPSSLESTSSLCRWSTTTSQR